jgi:hypothetical protein
MENRLDKLGLKYDTDKSSQDHNFLNGYEKAFKTLEVKSLLEIGIFKGGSIRAFSEFFPDAKIIGIDTEEKYMINEGNIKSYCMDQKDITGLVGLQSIYDFDVIIEDGSHYWGDQMRTFFTLFPLMKSGSIYIMEDVHTSYHSYYNDGVCNPLNIMNNWSTFNNILCIEEVGNKDDHSRSLIIWRK